MKPLTRLAIVVLATLLQSLAAPGFAQLGRPEGLYYKSWGVVIGIDNYLVAPKLTWAVADAKAVAGALRQLGFEEVIEVYDKDAKSRNVKELLNNSLMRKVGRQDRVVIFFAGHADVTRDMNGKELGYLVPWDAQPTNASKALTLDDLKEFSRRAMAKHILFLLDVGIAGWEVTPPQQLSLEGRMSPEDETDKRAVQIFTAAGKGETPVQQDGLSVFVKAFVTGLKGAADGDKNGWVMASELGAYVKRQVEQATQGTQHPQFARLDGDGDAVLIEGKKSAYRAGPEPQTQEERAAAAKQEYEQAFSLLQQQKSAQEALERLDKAIGYDPSFGDAYVLKSYLLLEFQPNLDQALVAAELGIKYAPKNPDSFYTLGLVLQRKGRFADAEQALRKAIAVNPTYTDVFLTLGDLYAQDLKDQKKAVESYQRYLETGGTENRVREYLSRAGATQPAEKQ
ncbi:MAG: caspase family protein [Nitrospirota bacterium]